MTTSLEKTNKELFILSPFEMPDVRLAIETIRSGAFPILHLGRSRKTAEKSIKDLSSRTQQEFGVCIASDEVKSVKLSANVTKVILPFGMDISVDKSVEILYQIHSIDEAKAAIKKKVSAIVIKGSEGAGKTSNESSFILFQGVAEAAKKAKVQLYIQGGAGVHTSAAFLSLGAQGVIFDSQIAAFPECSAPRELKNLCTKLSGTEIAEIADFKVLSRNNSPALPENVTFNDLLPFLGGYDIAKNYLPMGQDIALSSDLYRQYKKLREFVFAFYEAAHGHTLQAKKLNIIGADSPFAKEFGIKYPISQGPMGRISDVPEFVKEVAEAGALPFLSISNMTGEPLQETLNETVKLLGSNAWGVCLIGFNMPEIFREQVEQLKKIKPKVILITGGHSMIAKEFAGEDSKIFFHVPSTSLLEQYIKDGITNLIFEGRECGGHIGPFWSTCIWEKQINRLMQEDNLSKYNVLFAGGIHDAFSSAFISIMAAELAARGAKVGVQMGTPYLYTKEIVKTGAISNLYQKLSLENSETALVESAPGQVSRLIPTPVVDYFNSEKQRLIAEGVEPLDMRIALENLLVGRLRVASKGLLAEGDKLTKQSPEEQLKNGLYMIGDTSLFTNKTTTLEKLHMAVAEDNQKILSELKEIAVPAALANPVNIAVIGMECLMPEAINLEEYWKNILLGKDCITEVPDIRWNKDVFYKEGTTDLEYIPSNKGGFVPEIDFDPMEFGLTPLSMASIEPLQLLSLLIAKRALENAGYGDMSADESENTSVIFAGEAMTDLAARTSFSASYRQLVGELPEELKTRLPQLNTDSFTGLLANCTPGRIANRLNLKGQNFAMTSACASSLTALNLACKDLINYDSDMVVFGSHDLHNMLNDYYLFSSTQALSHSGRCASFDEKADGIALGEGVGVLILKRLEDAELTGDKIYAVIKGVGGSSDGKGLGMTAPNQEGQMLAIQRAYREAGVLPSEVGMIEAHGTGTVVGDRTEIRSTSSVLWNAGATAGQAYLGTVKSQIGHTKCSAGMAGLLKTILSVHHGIVPPTIHLDKPLDLYNSNISPFIFNTQAGIWSSDKRIAGISAFGFGGANAHAVIENYKAEVSDRNTLKMFPTELFVFRGDTMKEAKERVEKLLQLLSINNTLSLRDLAYTLATESNKPIQIITLASSVADLSERMLEINFDEKNTNLYRREEKSGKVAFLFSGQGSQRVNMARDLFVAFPAMRRLLLQNREYEKILFPHAQFSEAEKRESNKIITDTRNAQPVLGIVDYAIAEYLRYLGIEPDMVAGHSYGELPALCFAGAFDSEKLVELSRERANSILKSVGKDTGKMAAVGVPVEELNKLLEGEKEVWAVNFNSPKQTVIAGSTKGMEKFFEKMAFNNVAYKEINVACAFHSPLLAKSEKLYTEVLKDVPFGKLQLPVYSNTTAELYPEKGEDIKKRLAKHLVQPVLFSKEIEKMYADGARLFIETGPGSVLTGLAQSILGNDITTIQTEARGKEGITFLLHALAKYLTSGKTFDVAKLFEERGAKTIEIDNPEKYRKSKMIWRVNGQYAYPAEGQLPSLGGLPFEKPLGLKLVSEEELSSMAASYTPDTTNSSDQVMMEYLGSVRSMIQNQRDVMLTYFGQNPQEVSYRPVESSAAAEAAPIKALKPSEPLTTAQPALTVTVLTTEQITKTLLDVVSDKTGYPVEMLGMDMDLEGDLSIDSIKRMEIIGEMRDRLNLGDDIGNTEENFFKMASLKTLNELIGWIDELTAQTAIAVPAVAVEAQTTAPTAQTAQKLDIEHIKTTLLDVVSDKTGYPVEMLGMDLDLEGDLSIDSIKRMEIIGEMRDRLQLGDDIGNTEENFFKMASLKTLNELIGWIDELNSQTAVPVVIAETQAIAPIVQIAPKLDIEFIKTTLLDVVSDKTGYPTEMLGMDLDLEGDLSIDSIKRMEIIGEMRDRLNLGDDIGNTEENFFKMASLKTLNELIAWIEELTNTTNISVSNVVDVEIIEEIKEEKIVELSRILFDLQAHPLQSGKISIEGKRFAITDDGKMAEQIKSLLESAGTQAEIIQADANLDTFDGLILVNVAKSPNQYSIENLFKFITGGRLSHLKWVFTFSDIVGQIEKSKNLKDIKQIQGFGGLLKSLRLEYPEVKFRSVLSKTLFNEKNLPQIVLNEITVDDDSPEIVYNNGERSNHTVRIEDLTIDESVVSNNLKLNNESVVLVLGGAQGISPELTAQLATEYPCRYILVGRSSQIEDPNGAYAKLKTNVEIRKYLLSVEGMKVPAEIEKKIQQVFKSNQIAEAVAKIEATGAKVEYHSVDVSDTKKFKSFLKSVKKEYGKIDGVIHAAGLIQDKFFADKTWDSFEKVYQTKVNPLHVIIDELKNELKLLVLFSSVASSYGSRGQSDYATANSVLDLAASFNGLSPDLRVVAFNWGPWKGAGMVSDTLEAEFERRGVPLIPLKQGGAYFVQELKYGNASGIIVMGGRDKVLIFIQNMN
ncbi:MAG: SDR family NAD(P)-dependent oxidoreductase [Dysgonamonadaceae bacterium]|jgi:acyl transferase domain-containing protein/NAD(P)H-dependent flavin oxidoreductase YrpB (nitropropane dioxygenase family)/NAD(P)-dependent dehydrogenase (short-subunit alcohol dehydrogenase family)/acyl carrier protein|nr:SDR family NAD(P)-dependent oxidoreductase [Dysgonamonadaceae bacterium]